jgi:hypothetical protein
MATKKQDNRRSEIPLGEHVSLNLTSPPVVSGISPAEYYDNLRATNKARGDLVLTHDFKSSTNEYTFGHDFVSFVMVHKKAMEHKRINLGGFACKSCTRVHRLDELMRLEKVWRTSNGKFNAKLIDVAVKSKCDEDDVDEDDVDDDSTDADISPPKAKRLLNPTTECTQGRGIQRLAVKFADIEWEDLDGLAMDEYLTLFTTPSEVFLAKIFWKRFLARD